MRVLISWGADDDNDDGVGIGADSSGGGRRIHPPSSRRLARHAADLLARDASYGVLRTPLHKAVAGGRPLAAQLLVRASRHRGILREAMRARDASGPIPLESVRTYASIPPDEAETEGAYGDLRTPHHKAVAGGRPLAAQLLVHASRAAFSGRRCRRGMRWGVPRSSRRALTPRYPPTRRKRRGRGFGGGTWRRAGRGPGGRCGVDGGLVNTWGGGVSSFRVAN
jgi:hypothetical protein